MSVPSIVETRQYLTFQLGDEVFALDVSRVREILECTTITRVPRTPDYMRGVINLRGNVVPVVDMRLKLGLRETEKTVDTCIVVVEIGGEGESIVMGALVDSVQEVIEIEHDQIEPAPKIGIRLNTDFVAGMGKKDDRFVIILNMDKVLSSDKPAGFHALETEEEAQMAGNE
jgi:purine-binding chemotaxis protein CheW